MSKRSAKELGPKNPVKKEAPKNEKEMAEALGRVDNRQAKCGL